MAISTEESRNDYVGTGSLDTYNFTFKIFEDTDLLVTQRTTADVESTLVLTTDYTVDGVGDSSGGSITLQSGTLASGYTLTIRRVRPLTQETDIRNQGSFFPETHEDAFDHVVMIAQQHQDDIDRSVKLPESISGSDFDVSLPADTANSAAQILAVNADGDGFEWVAATGSLTLGVRSGVVPGVSNLSLAVASGTLTFSQQDGSALSSTAPAYITMPGVTPGRIVRLLLTANVTLDDDAHATDSDIVGEEFGTTTGVAWANDRPFYIYAVNTADTNAGLYLAISPKPTLTSTPSSGNNIGYKDVPAVTPSDSNLFFLTSTDATSFTDKPVMRIGGIRMRKSVLDDWTIQTLSTSYNDGILQAPFAKSSFTFPTGQMGAQSGSYFTRASFPTWATASNIVYKYSIDPDSGIVQVSFSTAGAGNCTNGGAANGAAIALPYASDSGFYSSSNYGYLAGGYITLNGTAAMRIFEIRTSAVEFNTSAYAAINNNDFANAADDVSVSLSYKAF